MKKGIVYSATRITSMLVTEMLKGIFEVINVKDYNTLKSLMQGEELDFLIIDRNLKEITSKNLFQKLVKDEIGNIPPIILLTQEKYHPREDGEGYSFILRKPFLKIELIEAVNFVLFNKNKESVKTILLIDDSRTSRKIIIKKLKPFGYNFIEAETPSESLKILETKKPDIIIVDYEMPEMNGLEFARKISCFEKLNDIPIVLLTGLKDIESVKEEGFNSGISEYFQKPLNEEEIERFFRGYLKRGDTSKILVIDDSSTKRKILYANLRINNNRVITVENISKAKALLEDNKFDIILSDLVLKNENAFDGISVFRKINKIIPIIVYSAIADRKNIYKVLELGANDYLWSPIEMKELLLKTKIWVDFYKIYQENNLLKITQAKEKNMSFLEIIEEKFARSNINDTISSLVYVDVKDENIINKIKSLLRKSDLYGFIEKNFFIFFQNSDYVNTLRVCKRLEESVMENIEFGIAPTNIAKNIDSLTDYAVKNKVNVS